MIIKFPYGKGFLEADLPEERLEVVESRPMRGIRDPKGAIGEALRNPIGTEALGRLIKGGDRALILVPDITRACPSREILPPLLEELGERGVGQVRIMVANGLHKPLSEREIAELVGEEVSEEVEVTNHDAADDDRLANLGKKTSYGTPVVVSREVMESDLVIGLGLIEPHFFAGYSGGRKIILPGVAGAEAIFSNHGFGMIEHPSARCGVLDGNPVHEDMMEFLSFTRLHFVVNVAINRRGELAGVFGGGPVEAHAEGVRLLDRFVRVGVRGRGDVVIVTNGGYPLDRDVYQAVKGMATAETVVREGGVIVVAAECSDGFGGHTEFRRLIEGTEDPAQIIGRIKEEGPVLDQWQAQVFARILRRARIVAVTGGVRDSVIEGMQMTPASSLEEALETAASMIGGEAFRIAAIPEGPYVIPRVLEPS